MHRHGKPCSGQPERDGAAKPLRAAGDEGGARDGRGDVRGDIQHR
jgi:hypothetical protein